MESRKNNTIFFSSGMLDPSPKLNIPRQSSVREPQLTLEENDGYRGPWAGKGDNERAIVMYFWHTLRTVQGANCIEVLSYSMVTQSFWKLTKVSLFGRETLFLEKKNAFMLPSKTPPKLFPGSGQITWIVPINLPICTVKHWRACLWLPGWTPEKMMDPVFLLLLVIFGLG